MSEFKCADRLLRWPPTVAKLQRQLENLDLEIQLLGDLGRRPALAARRRELLAQLEVAKRATLAQESAA
jgi:hypothetical protein